MILPVHIDFETYSESKGPRDVGSVKYAEHPSTEVLCLAYARGDEEPRLWTPRRPPPRDLFGWIKDGALVWAWNVEFEIPIWERICVDQLMWPSVAFEQWRDTAVVSLAHALPVALDAAGAALGLSIQKDPKGDALIRKLCKPRKPTKNNPLTRLTPQTNPDDFAALYRYCLQDVRSERAIHHALPQPDLSPEELETWRMTVQMNMRGWAIDHETVRRLLRVLAEDKRIALDQVATLTKGRVRTANQIDEILSWLDDRGAPLPNLQADTVEDALKRDDLPLDVRRLLEIRREQAKASVKKYSAMISRLCEDGTVKNNILYHGAATGRDTGRGIQIQNFVRKSVAKTSEGIERACRLLRTENPREAVSLIYGSVPHFASTMTRHVLIARPGYDLLCGDYSQIENRVAIWYAGCEYGLGIYARGADEYRTYAADFYKVAYEDVTDDQRQHCKHQVLGFVFGMGEETYVRQAEKFGQRTTMREAQIAKNRYRETYHEVVAMWYGLNEAALEAAKGGQRTSYRSISFFKKGRFLYMQLASGRRLAYFEPKVKMMRVPWMDREGNPVFKPTVTYMGIGYTHGWERMKMTPGAWFENAVQATARDIMMHGAKRVAAAGYHHVGRVHDEIVSERRIGEGSLAEYLSLMGNPRWLPREIKDGGIPIIADGWRGRRYRKG